MAVTHAKTSVIADGGDASLVNPSDWNDDHVTGGVITLDGVAFPATQVPSAGANTLDDYEEADYDPTANVVTFASSEGRYTKVGRLVTFQFDVTWPTTSDTNQARISLPLTCGSVGASCQPFVGTALYNEAAWGVLASTAYLQYTLAAGGAGTNAALSEVRMMGSITYSV